MLELPGGVAILLVALTISVTSDPRKMRTALYLFECDEAVRLFRAA